MPGLHYGWSSISASIWFPDARPRKIHCGMCIAFFFFTLNFVALLPREVAWSFEWEFLQYLYFLCEGVHLLAETSLVESFRANVTFLLSCRVAASVFRCTSWLPWEFDSGRPSVYRAL